MANVKTTPMKVETVKEFASTNGFISVAEAIRENAKGYPYVTFLNDKNEAENIYFSKEASKQVTAGEVITPELLKKYQIGHTINDAGEARIKLISNSGRILLTDLFLVSLYLNKTLLLHY